MWILPQQVIPPTNKLRMHLKDIMCKKFNLGDIILIWNLKANTAQIHFPLHFTTWNDVVEESWTFFIGFWIEGHTLHCKINLWLGVTVSAFHVGYERLYFRGYKQDVSRPKASLL